ncbi:MAG: FkbM family methyltransferase [Cyclobacteriaceae bacterium]
MDVGANIGYMSLAMLKVVGKSGRLHAFEPHPNLHDRLKQNINLNYRQQDIPGLHIHQTALSNKSGAGNLYLPKSFAYNEGTASLTETESSVKIPIELECLDNILGVETFVDLMKLDVEGHELDVLLGAKNLLKNKQIRHILYESHHTYPDDVSQLLIKSGYTLFKIWRNWFKPKLISPAIKVNTPIWYTPNYLATHAPERVIESFSKFGWKSLSYRI